MNAFIDLSRLQISSLPAMSERGKLLQMHLTVPPRKRKASERVSRYEASHLTDRPGRNRTCNPRFWSAVLATPALQPLLIFKHLALSEQRRRRWTTPALALILALRRRARQPIHRPRAPASPRRRYLATALGARGAAPAGTRDYCRKARPSPVHLPTPGSSAAGRWQRSARQASAGCRL